LVKIHPVSPVNILWDLSWKHEHGLEVIKNWQQLGKTLTKDITMNLTIDNGGLRSTGQYSGNNEHINLKNILNPLISINNQQFKPTVYSEYVKVLEKLAGCEGDKCTELCYGYDDRPSYNNMSSYPFVSGLSEKGAEVLLKYYAMHQRVVGLELHLICMEDKY